MSADPELLRRAVLATLSRTTMELMASCDEFLSRREIEAICSDRVAEVRAKYESLRRSSGKEAFAPGMVARDGDGWRRTDENR